MVGAPTREGGRKDATLSVRIEQDVKVKLKRMAFDAELSLSAYIQYMAYHHLQSVELETYQQKEDHEN
jgi:predicted transcriptional regulator